jgi:hypothetical protein
MSKVTENLAVRYSVEVALSWWALAQVGRQCDRETRRTWAAGAFRHR